MAWSTSNCISDSSEEVAGGAAGLAGSETVVEAEEVIEGLEAETEQSLAHLLRSDSRSLHLADKIAIDSDCCFSCASSSLTFSRAKSLSTTRFSFSNSTGSIARVGLFFLFVVAFTVTALLLDEVVVFANGNEEGTEPDATETGVEEEGVGTESGTGESTASGSINGDEDTRAMGKKDPA